MADFNGAYRAVNGSNDPLVIDEFEQISVMGLTLLNGNAQVNSITAPIISGGSLYISGDVWLQGVIRSTLNLSDGITFPDGIAAAPAISFTSAPGTGIWRDSADGVNVSVGGVAKSRQIASALELTTAITTPTGSGQNLVLNPDGPYIDLTGHTLINAGGISITVGNPNEVIVNNPLGVLSSEPHLAPVRGGTGMDSTPFTGIPHVVSGIWSVSPVVDADVASYAAIARSKIATSTPNAVVINNAGGVLSVEAQLAPIRGGLGIDTSGSTGIPRATAGSWVVDTIEDADVKSTAAIARSKLAAGSANAVVINNVSGIMTTEAQLAPVRGGTGLNTSASTGVAQVSAGTWSVGTINASQIGSLSSITVGQINPVASTITVSGGLIHTASGTAGGSWQRYVGATTTVGNTTANAVSIPTETNSAYMIRYTAVGFDTTGGTATMMQTAICKVKNIAGVLTVSGDLQNAATRDVGLASTSVSVVASGTNIIIQVSGQAGRTLSWSASGELLAKNSTI